MGLVRTIIKYNFDRHAPCPLVEPLRPRLYILIPLLCTVVSHPTYKHELNFVLQFHTAAARLSILGTKRFVYQLKIRILMVCFALAYAISEPLWYV